MLKEITKEAHYSPKQIFNVDKTGLFWKGISLQMYVSQYEGKPQDMMLPWINSLFC
jgi:hypothetical protein